MNQESKNQHADHRAKLNRVRRLEGQVRGVGKMIERGEYCVDILTQLRAISRATKNLELLILEDHAAHCIRHAFEASSEESEQKIRELLGILKGSLK